MCNLDQAVLLTAERFQGLVDEEGQPYILHCLRVMLNFADPDLQMVAVMHDLIEDTETGIDELRRMGFEPRIVNAVELLTRTDGVSYCDYVCRLKEDELARQVKLADLRDNSNIARALLRADRQHEDLRRGGKYILSYQFLEGRIDRRRYIERMRHFEDLASP